MMFAVVVTFQIAPDAMNAFLPAMRENARLSLTNEVGCRRFDVCTDSSRPDEVFLYEIYDNRAAFDAHLMTQHFKSFDAEVAPMVIAKDVRTYDEVTS